SQDQLLTAKYSNGRGPFSGVAAEVGASVIYVDFNDARPGTGVMGINGNGLILWNNGTEWKQNGAKT
ncbi:MAG TPA: hypothetical protein VFS20_31110, partial [Longimicrobium sp.]|nr:hypothetical protein [Longimicrobium sp.]